MRGRAAHGFVVIDMQDETARGRFGKRERNDIGELGGHGSLCVTLVCGMLLSRVFACASERVNTENSYSRYSPSDM